MYVFWARSKQLNAHLIIIFALRCRFEEPQPRRQFNNHRNSHRGVLHHHHHHHSIFSSLFQLVACGCGVTCVSYVQFLSHHHTHPSSYPNPYNNPPDISLSVSVTKSVSGFHKLARHAISGNREMGKWELGTGKS